MTQEAWKAYLEAKAQTEKACREAEKAYQRAKDSIMNKLSVKALGQTIQHKGETILVVKEMPSNCMVLFVSQDTWKEIKENVEIIKIEETR